MSAPNPGQILRELYDADREKFLDDPADAAMFDAPLVGVARADDPWFARLKEMLGDFYWTPQEALELSAPGATARSVVSWCLPVCEAARRDNRRAERLPARRWVYVRAFGEPFVTRLRRGMEAHLRAMGYAAVAPAVAPENSVRERPGVGLCSCWSERHTAFVAGLGTFGLSGGLITRRGIAHRLGSVVTDAEIAATARPYGDDPFAWCLRLARGTCGVCAQRCPGGSVGETLAERNKDACRQHVRETIQAEGRALYRFEPIRGCGLCQTAVPCEARNPTEDRS
jgi:epoxyqueuosine reductase QueG